MLAGMEAETAPPEPHAEDGLRRGLATLPSEAPVGAEEAVEHPLRGGAGEHLGEGPLERGRDPGERVPGEGAQARDGAAGSGYFATSTQRKPRKSPSAYPTARSAGYRAASASFTLG